MRQLVLILALVMFAFTANAQIESFEGTFSWDDQTEVLVPDEGNFPPDTELQRTTWFGRARLLNSRGFPVVEFRYSSIDPVASDAVWSDMRAAALLPMPWKGWFLKAQIVHESWPNPVDEFPYSNGQNDYGSAYLIGNVGGLQFAGGLDRRVIGTPPASMQTQPHLAGTMDTQQTNASFRAKYDIGKLQLMAGGSSVTAVSDETLEMERFTGGAVYKLPYNLMLGGSVGTWDDELGYSFNIGRFKDFGKMGGAPSFALNYLEVPTMYKWTNFRIMWGDRPGHYVLPTFINPVFGGMHDLNAALMLQELVPDNYRHFDTPLLFRRYDEYGKYCLRVNYIEAPSTFRKFDANFSTNMGLGIGVFKELRSIVTVERIHNPAFGWQDLRYHVTGAAYIMGKVYTGVTYGTDLNDFSRVMVEARLMIGPE